MTPTDICEVQMLKEASCFFVVYSVSRSKDDVGGMEEGWEVVCVGALRGGHGGGEVRGSTPFS